MNWYSQLTQLILSFYREDLPQLERLSPLYTCKVSRRWGVFRIDCREYQTAERLTAAIDLLREPIAQLRLSHQIKITVRGTVVAVLPVDSPKRQHEQI